MTVKVKHFDDNGNVICGIVGDFFVVIGVGDGGKT